MGKKPKLTKEAMKNFEIRDFKPNDPLPPLFEPGGGMKEIIDQQAERDAVTAEVTEPPRKLEQWEIAGLTKEEWDGLMIPTFLLRGHPDCTTITPTATPPNAPSRPTPTPATPKDATAPAADASAGSSSGESTKPTNPGVTGTFDFNQYRVDPAEIESKIRAEADRRYYQWEGPHRPRKSTLLKRVRKEYYK